MQEAVKSIYGNKVRVRACGLCWDENRLLVVSHAGLGPADFWAPPGGGVEFGFSVHQNLEREFLEETGLAVEVGPFRFVCEVVRPPLYAVELFFQVNSIGGQLRTGTDPELNIIKDVRFMRWEELMAIPPSDRHGIFQLARSAEDLREMSGFHRI